ncbi:MAG: TIGR04388 family protein, partial [Spirochaetota bacterium]
MKIMRKNTFSNRFVFWQRTTALVSIFSLVYLLLFPSYEMHANPNHFVPNSLLGEGFDDSRMEETSQQAAVKRNLDTWQSHMDIGLGAYRAEWEMELDLQIQQHLGNTSTSDYYNDSETHHDYAAKVYAAEKKARLANWEAEANAYILLKRSEYSQGFTEEALASMQQYLWGKNYQDLQDLGSDELYTELRNWYSSYNELLTEGEDQFSDYYQDLYDEFVGFRDTILAQRQEYQESLQTAYSYKVNVINGVDREIAYLNSQLYSQNNISLYMELGSSPPAGVDSLDKYIETYKDTNLDIPTEIAKGHLQLNDASGNGLLKLIDDMYKRTTPILLANLKQNIENVFNFNPNEYFTTATADIPAIAGVAQDSLEPGLDYSDIANHSTEFAMTDFGTKVYTLLQSFKDNNITQVRSSVNDLLAYINDKSKLGEFVKEGKSVDEVINDSGTSVRSAFYDQGSQLYYQEEITDKDGNKENVVKSKLKDSARGLFYSVYALDAKLQTLDMTINWAELDFSEMDYSTVLTELSDDVIAYLDKQEKYTRRQYLDFESKILEQHYNGKRLDNWDSSIARGNIDLRNQTHRDLYLEKDLYNEGNPYFQTIKKYIENPSLQENIDTLKYVIKDLNYKTKENIVISNIHNVDLYAFTPNTGGTWNKISEWSVGASYKEALAAGNELALTNTVISTDNRLQQLAATMSSISTRSDTRIEGVLNGQKVALQYTGTLFGFHFYDYTTYIPDFQNYIERYLVCSSPTQCVGVNQAAQESKFYYRWDYTTKDLNMQSKYETWKEFHKEMATQLSRWQTQVQPAVSTWESNVNYYKEYVDQWTEAATDLLDDAWESYKDSVKELDAKKSTWIAKMLEQKIEGEKKWQTLFQQASTQASVPGEEIPVFLQQEEDLAATGVFLNFQEKIAGFQKETFSIVARDESGRLGDTKEVAIYDPKVSLAAIDPENLDFASEFQDTLAGTSNFLLLKGYNEEIDRTQEAYYQRFEKEAIKYYQYATIVDDDHKHLYEPNDEGQLVLTSIAQAQVNACFDMTASELADSVASGVCGGYLRKLSEEEFSYSRSGNQITVQKTIHSGKARKDENGRYVSVKETATETITLSTTRHVSLADVEVAAGAASGSRLFTTWGRDQYKDVHTTVHGTWEDGKLVQAGILDLNKFFEQDSEELRLAIETIDELNLVNSEIFQSEIVRLQDIELVQEALMASATGGAEAANRVVQNQVLSTVTGWPVGFISGLQGAVRSGENLNDAMRQSLTNYSKQLAIGEVSRITGIPPALVSQYITDQTTREPQFYETAGFSLGMQVLGAIVGGIVGFITGGPAGAVYGAMTGMAIAKASVRIVRKSANGELGNSIAADIVDIAANAAVAYAGLPLDVDVSYDAVNGFGGSIGVGVEGVSAGVSFSEGEGAGVYAGGEVGGVEIGGEYTEGGGFSAEVSLPDETEIDVSQNGVTVSNDDVHVNLNQNGANVSLDGVGQANVTCTGDSGCSGSVDAEVGDGQYIQVSGNGQGGGVAYIEREGSDTHFEETSFGMDCDSSGCSAVADQSEYYVDDNYTHVDSDTLTVDLGEGSLSGSLATTETETYHDNGSSHTYEDSTVLDVNCSPAGCGGSLSHVETTEDTYVTSNGDTTTIVDTETASVGCATGSGCAGSISDTQEYSFEGSNGDTYSETESSTLEVSCGGGTGCGGSYEDTHSSEQVTHNADGSSSTHSENESSTINVSCTSVSCGGSYSETEESTSTEVAANGDSHSASSSTSSSVGCDTETGCSGSYANTEESSSTIGNTTTSHSETTNVSCAAGQSCSGSYSSSDSTVVTGADGSTTVVDYTEIGADCQAGGACSGSIATDELDDIHNLVDDIQNFDINDLVDLPVGVDRAELSAIVTSLSPDEATGFIDFLQNNPLASAGAAATTAGALLAGYYYLTGRREEEELANLLGISTNDGSTTGNAPNIGNGILPGNNDSNSSGGFAALLGGIWNDAVDFFKNLISVNQEDEDKRKAKFEENKEIPNEFLVTESTDQTSFEAKGELTEYVNNWL